MDRRLITLILFSVATSALAAPVPTGRTIDPFATGFLTADDLKKIHTSDPAPFGPELPSSTEISLHVPNTRIRSGEPIPAYFLVRNTTDKPVGLDIELELFTDAYHTDNASRIELRSRDTELPVLKQQLHTWACGGPPMVQVAAQGFYVSRGDLSRHSGGYLPPGEYEIRWRYQQKWSNVVRFSVTGSAVKAIDKPRPVVRFLKVQPLDVLQKQVAEVDDTEGHAVFWRKPSLSNESTSRMAAWFGTGVAGKHYPDILALPRNDGRVIVTADWYFTSKRDSVTIKIEAAIKNKPVVFEDYPEIFLQVESDERGVLEREHQEEAKEMMKQVDGGLI